MLGYRIIPEQKLIAICNVGDTTAEESIRFVQELHSDPDYSPSYDSIIDNTHVELVLSRRDVDILASPRINASMSDGKIALIAPEDIPYVISQSLAMTSESMGGALKINVFRNSTLALKWLGREGFDIESIFNDIMDGMD